LLGLAGESLVDIDPRDYTTALEQAQGAYAQAQAQLRAENPNVPITRKTNETTISTADADVIAAEKAVAQAEQEYQAKMAQIRQAEAQNVKAQTDVRRYELLVDKEEISREQFDTVVANAKSQKATVDSSSAAAEAAQRAAEARRAQLLQARSRLSEAQQNAPRQIAVRQADVATREANLIAAKARLDQAGLELSYTKILAPVNGVVSNKTAEVGQHVQAGEQLLQISQLDDIWVTANFKETQVKRMRPGQSVDIHVDAFDQTFPGYVESLPGSTGAKTSLLPPENATGNYVKVVQRLPVRIRFKQGADPQHRLRLGMSVEPKVWLY
jgi:membrane fusion protein (multidrug efflux system)